MPVSGANQIANEMFITRCYTTSGTPALTARVTIETARDVSRRYHVS